MEGVGGGVFGCGIFSPQKINIMNHHHGFTPPLSAIDRFLYGQSQTQTDHFSHPNNIMNHNKEIPISSNGFISNVSSPPVTNNNYENGGGIIWPSGGDDCNFVDGSETRNWDRNLNLDRNKEEAQSVAKKKKVKGGYPSNLIKGQWTDEEDRKLIRLVKQFGVRKWAQIAEKMFGRAGKQCRERWHNHLRPDIKKDGWSEEEERMLVEAHRKVGNKWADIAKGIPGRSENSIKNHWNATKRRQNSKRKSKKNEAKNGNNKPQQSLLQDYIRTKILEETNNIINNNDNNNNNNTSTTSIVSTNTSNTTPTNSSTIISDDPSVKFDLLFPQSPSEDSTSLITPTSDEELNFMQRLFTSDNLIKAPNPLVDDGKLLANSLGAYNCFSSTTSETTNYKDINNIVPKEVALDNMHPDHYLSFLLDGSTPNFSSNDDVSNVDFEQMNQASSSGTKKEMDLIEMVLASQCSQGIK